MSVHLFQLLTVGAVVIASWLYLWIVYDATLRIPFGLFSTQTCVNIHFCSVAHDWQPVFRLQFHLLSVCDHVETARAVFPSHFSVQIAQIFQSNLFKSMHITRESKFRLPVSICLLQHFNCEFSCISASTTFSLTEDWVFLLLKLCRSSACVPGSVFHIHTFIIGQTTVGRGRNRDVGSGAGWGKRCGQWGWVEEEMWGGGKRFEQNLSCYKW